METPEFVTLNAPRIEEGRPMLIVGLQERFSEDTESTGIPMLWQQFGAHADTLPNVIDGANYGVCSNVDAECAFDYLAGIEVSDDEGVAPEFARIALAAQRYAVFTHDGHISTIKAVYNTIWGHWMPSSGHTGAAAPTLERYGNEFDAATGMGGFELWLPIQV